MRIAGILLAAGLSTRFGSQKLLAELPDGGTLFSRAVRIHLEATVRPFVIVVSEEVLNGLTEVSNRSEWRIAKKGPEAWYALTCFWGEGRLVVNSRPEEGMASSLKTGLRCLTEREQKGGILFSLADLPLLTSETIRILVARYKKWNKRVVLPVYKGRTGHPVIVDGSYLKRQIANVKDDKGLRDIIRSAPPGDVGYVPWPDGSVTADIDTASDMEVLKNGRSGDGN